MNALSFITTTRGVAPANTQSPTGDHQLTVVGYRRPRERVYFLESYSGDDQAPSLFSMNLTGQYAGRTVPVKEAANENDRDAVSLERRVMTQLADLAPLLRPLRLMDPGSIEISTRVVRKTALVLGSETAFATSSNQIHDTSNTSAPVRKFVVKVALGRQFQASAWRHHYISTYLRPRVTLDRVYEIPNRSQAIAVLSYVGLPYGIGDRVEQPVLVELD